MTRRLSANRYLTLVTGIIISFKDEEDGNYSTRVKDSDGNLHTFDDDPFGTITSLVFDDIYDRAAHQLGKHRFDRFKVDSAMRFYGHFQYDCSRFFQQSQFEEFVYPILQGLNSTEMRGLLQWYDEVKDCKTSAEDIAECTEVVFRIFSYLRRHPVVFPISTNVGVAGSLSDAVAGKCDTVALSSADDPFLPALKALFPDGEVFEMGDPSVFYYSWNRFDPFSVIGGKQYQPDTCSVVIRKSSGQVSVTKETKVEVEELAVPKVGDEMGVAMGQVARLKGRPVQKLLGKDAEYVSHGGFEAEFQQLSGNALKHHGKIIGVGNLEDCIRRLADHLVDKSGLDFNICLHIAASRLIRMNEKRVVKRDGVYQVIDGR